MPKATSAAASQPVAPLLAGDEARYRRRYRALKDLVNELSDESDLLALRVFKIQRAIYDQHMQTLGQPPDPVTLPDGASWAPLIGNRDTYPEDTGAPQALSYDDDPDGEGYYDDGDRTLGMDMDDDIEAELEDGDDDVDDAEIGELADEPQRPQAAPPRRRTAAAPRRSQAKSRAVKPEIEEDELDELDDEPAQASSVKEPARGARSRRGTGAPAKRRSTGGTARRASGRSSRGVKRERELELERERERELERERERDVDDEIGDELDLAASAPQSPRDHDDY